MVNLAATCASKCLLTNNPCILAKLKSPWERGGFPLKNDRSLLDVLKVVKKKYDRERVRKQKGMTEEEERRIAETFASTTLNLAAANWQKAINEEKMRADWRQEKIAFLSDYIGSEASRTATMSENQGFVVQRRVELAGEGVSSNSSPLPLPRGRPRKQVEAEENNNEEEVGGEDDDAEEDPGGNEEESDDENERQFRHNLAQEKCRSKKRRSNDGGDDGDDTIAALLPLDILRKMTPLCEKLGLTMRQQLGVTMGFVELCGELN